MRVNSAEVEAEFDEIATEVRRLASKLRSLDADSPLAPGSQAEWEASLVCGSATEKIYTGCERIMAGLAGSIDGESIMRDGNWHRVLLDRMRQPFGPRGPIIEQKTFELLDRMRSFRHRERNSYGHGLRFDIVVERAREMIQGFDTFAADVRRFLSADPLG
jgi:hypothetical protein